MSIATSWQSDTAGSTVDVIGADVPSDPSTGTILAWLTERKSERGLAMEMARIMSEAYGGRLAIALPEIDKSEPLSVANYVSQGIDQYALRVAILQPEITYFSTAPGRARADAIARNQRRVSLAWWEMNDMEALDQKRARELVAYARAPVLVEPNMRMKQPRWQHRSALSTYASTPLDTLEIAPDDAIFTYMRTWAWLKRTYPDAARQIAYSRLAGDKPKNDDMVDIIEYVDDKVRVLICAGRGRHTGMVREAEYGVNGAVILNLETQGPNQWAIELKRIRNKAGICPVAIPSRISLDDAKGQFDDALGIFQLLAKMQAMNVNAIANGIWPNTWLVHSPNAVGKVIKMADGLRGVIGEVSGGTLDIKVEQPNPQVMNMLNYLERAFRQNASMPAEFGGESPTNVRTDRRGLTVEGATVDYFIAAYQTAFARSKKQELVIAQEIDKAYFGSAKKSFVVNWKGTSGNVDYVPKDLWVTDRPARVSYAYLGMDVNAATVRQGQLVGMGAMSVETVMKQSPDVIEDWELEMARIDAESLRGALRGALDQQAQQGTLDPQDLVSMIETRMTGVSLEASYIKAHEAAQARQAAAQAQQAAAPPAGAPAPPGGLPGGAPEAAAQPGMTPPGAQQPSIAPLAPSLNNYRGVLQELSKFKAAGKG